VDDEAVDQQTIRHILESGGRFRVLTAENYDQALAAVADRWDELDLALLDVALPGKNGVELAKQLLSRRPDLPILFISGHVGASVIRFYGIDASERHFLQKPFEGQKLLERVQDLMSSGEPLNLLASAGRDAPGAE